MITSKKLGVNTKISLENNNVVYVELDLENNGKRRHEKWFSARNKEINIKCDENTRTKIA